MFPQSEWKTAAAITAYFREKLAFYSLFQQIDLLSPLIQQENWLLFSMKKQKSYLV